tara:strand:+ start:38966 stop:39664 length:699 start_codon:yes stop_codon:yes gene_type:complete
MNEYTGAINEKYSNATDYLNLEDKLITLSDENARLHMQLEQSYLRSDNRFNPFIDTTYDQTYVYRTAKIINNEISKQDNFLMLDKGALSGIKIGMGVINSTGVIGVVTDVSKHYAVVMSVLNSRFQLGVRLQKTNYFGILDWDGTDPNYAILNNIQHFVEVSKGDTIQTLGASGIFPEGITVGTVDSVSALEESNSWRIKTRLTAKIQQAKYVYVLENIFEEEVEILEEAKE